MIFDSDEMVFDVVINAEKQYSIWPRKEPAPAGWAAVGRSGSRTECLDYIRETWSDMRPASLRAEI